MDMVWIEISCETSQNGEDYSRISKCLWQLNIFSSGVVRRDGPLQPFSPPQLNMLVILPAAFSASSATKTGSRWTFKMFHFACPNINVSIYNKIKIAPFTQDIFKCEYWAAGGSNGPERGSPWIDPGEFRLIKVVHIKVIVLFHSIQNSYITQSNAGNLCSRLMSLLMLIFLFMLVSNIKKDVTLSWWPMLIPVELDKAKLVSQRRELWKYQVWNQVE